MQLLNKCFLHLNQIFTPVSAEPCVGEIQWFFPLRHRFPFGETWVALGLNHTWTFLVPIIWVRRVSVLMVTGPTPGPWSEGAAGVEGVLSQSWEPILCSNYQRHSLPNQGTVEVPQVSHLLNQTWRRAAMDHHSKAMSASLLGHWTRSRAKSREKGFFSLTYSPLQLCRNNGNEKLFEDPYQMLSHGWSHQEMQTWYSQCPLSLQKGICGAGWEEGWDGSQSPSKGSQWDLHSCLWPVDQGPRVAHLSSPSKQLWGGTQPAFPWADEGGGCFPGSLSYSCYLTYRNTLGCSPAPPPWAGCTPPPLVRKSREFYYLQLQREQQTSPSCSPGLTKSCAFTLKWHLKHLSPISWYCSSGRCTTNNTL